MQFARNKTKATTIALFLVLTIAVTLVALPVASAHTPPWTIPTYAFIEVDPNPVGVGQTVLVVIWLDKPPPTAGGTGGDRWVNYTVTITKPNGDTETRGPYISDDTSSTFFTYTPDQVGTYTFVFNFPGQKASLYNPVTGIPASPDALARVVGGIAPASEFVNDTYLGSSATTTLTVQQAQLPSPPTFPLPTNYWTRPIEAENTAWAAIASNWLDAPQIYTRFQREGIAPNSPHIMWTKPLEFGGVVGGNYSAAYGMTFYNKESYESSWPNSMIISGKLYYMLPLGNNAQGAGYVCVDLRTGQQQWLQNYTLIYWPNPVTTFSSQNPTFGQLYDYESPNQHGVIPNGYLWAAVTDAANGGLVWKAYDPFTGLWLFNLTNVPTAPSNPSTGLPYPTNIVSSSFYTSNGEIVLFQMNYTGRWLAEWNNTAAIGTVNPTTLTGTPGEVLAAQGTDAWQWRPVGKNINASTAYSWNVTIPDLNGLATPQIYKVIPDDIMLGFSSNIATSQVGPQFTQDPYTIWAISLKPQSRGQLLWIKNYTAPSGNMTRRMGPVDVDTRVFTMADCETFKWLGYSLDTGDLLWGPTASPDLRAYQWYGSGTGSGQIGFTAYGNLYVQGYGGILCAYDDKTGKLIWEYGNGGPGNSTNGGLDSVWGLWPIFITAIADGKVYAFTNEHSPNAPPYKDETIRCLNATTGQEIWVMRGMSSQVGGPGAPSAIVADGYFAFCNIYDMQVYVIGKGPSATTVEAPMTAVTAGDSAVIQGTVTDQSAGAKGTPAVSDDSMSAWMEYLYMQKPRPTTATGVEVTLDAIDPNNNFIHIGTVTSDTSGNFGYAWKTPDVPGKYTVIATFAGSESYYASYAETYAVVSEVPAATPPPAYPVPIDYTMAIVGTAIAIIIAIAIVGILILRKK